MLVCWSIKRENRDQKTRQRQIEKANKMIEQKTKPSSKRGAARYLKTTGKQKVTGIDQDRIKKDQRWDGYYAMQTNVEMDYLQVIENYNRLWKIEDSFRVLKSTMKTRPIFHWTPKRIKGHFVLCFIAFMLERQLQLKLANNKINLSAERIKEVLNSLEVSKVKLNNQTYFLRGNAKKPAAKMLKAFRIKQPANLTPEKKFAIR